MSRLTLNELFGNLSRDKVFALYECQTTYIHDLLSRHPERIEVLTEEEKVIFERYFQPDWSRVGHFVQYYKRIEKEEPELIVRANRLLVSFLERNKLGTADIPPGVLGESIG